MAAVRFAFVGCGGIARHHLNALSGCGHAAQVVAAVDVQRKNAEEFVRLIPKEHLDAAENCQVSCTRYP